MKLAWQTSFVVLFLIATSQLHAEDKGAKHALWKWGSSSSSNSKDSSVFKTTSGPQLNLPKIQAFESAKETTGRALNSAKKTTSQMWNSTVDFLNPWDGKSASSNPKPKGDAWFFQKKEKPQAEYSSVNDFLRQDRPRF